MKSKKLTVTAFAAALSFGGLAISQPAIAGDDKKAEKKDVKKEEKKDDKKKDKKGAEKGKDKKCGAGKCGANGCGKK